MAIAFDAGTEFTTPDAVLQPAPSVAPQPASPPAAEAPPLPVADTTWDPDPEADPDTVQAAAQARSAQPSEIEIKGGKGVKRFKLDPADQELQTALKMGLGFRPMQAERDAARKEAATERAGRQKAEADAKIWSEVQELSKLGHRSHIARAVLGDDGYEAFRKEILAEHQALASDDADERYAAKEAADRRNQDLAKYQYERKLKDLETRVEARDNEVNYNRLNSLGTAELRANDFRGFVKDPDVANALNESLWQLAWADIETYADAHKLNNADVPPDVIRDTFARRAKILRGGQSQVVTERVAQVVEKRKEAAKRQVQAAATERYPTQQAAALDGWDGKSSKELLKRLVRGR